MHFDVITLFPQMFNALHESITGRALQEGFVQIQCWNPRDFSDNKHRHIDDRPYGGGPGMIMMAHPIEQAIKAAQSASTKQSHVIYLSPQGKTFNQQAAENLLKKRHLILIAGRYEGIDERLLAREVYEEWSIGDYILSGGELAAMVMIDTMTRLIPGVLGHEDSAKEDSLTSGLLKYPQYTRPDVFQGLSIPEVLKSGNHHAIEEWRLKQSLGRTWLKRPDLLIKMNLDKRQLKLLMEFIEEI